LHDIRLGDAAKAEEERSGKPVDWAGQHGPQWLFEAWPWEKMAGGTNGKGFGATNIGAIRMPDRRLAEADLSDLLARPWETEPDARTLRALGLR
jgi:hypothetical protein